MAGDDTAGRRRSRAGGGGSEQQGLSLGEGEEVAARLEGSSALLSPGGE